MPFSCLIYGLGVEVNVPIAGMRGLAAPERIDVRIEMGQMHSDLLESPTSAWRRYYESPDLDAAGLPNLIVDRLDAAERFYRISYRDGTVIAVDGKGARVWATWPALATVEDTATYLLGPILGFVLRLRGTTCLHGSAVAVGDRAIALVGPSGAGKSSTAAAFARLGYPVLTDDVVALSDGGDVFQVQPAYPRIRLWPEAVECMHGSADALPRITPSWDKRFLDTSGPPSRFQASALTLAAIYFLGERDPGQSSHTVAAVQPAAGLMTLVSDTYINYLLDRDLRAREFELLGRVVDAVPLRWLTPSGDMSRIDRLCRTILDDFHQLAGAGAQ